MYTIKNFKRFKGHEGEPLAQGTLYKGQIKVADWSDDSHGGMPRIDFINKAAESDFLAYAKTVLATKLDCDDEPYDLTKAPWNLMDAALNDLTTAHDEALTLQRYVKKGLCYRRMMDGKVNLYTSNAAYTATNVANIKAKFGADLVEIINETLGLALVDEESAKIAAQNAHYKKLCAKKMVFSVKKPDGSIGLMSSPAPYTSALAAQMRAKYPNLIEIINERYL